MIAAMKAMPLPMVMPMEHDHDDHDEHDQGQDNDDLHKATDGEGVHEGQKALDHLRTTPELFLSRTSHDVWEKKQFPYISDHMPIVSY